MEASGGDQISVNVRTTEVPASVHPVSVACVLIPEYGLDVAAGEVTGDQHSDDGQDPHRIDAMRDEEDDSQGKVRPYRYCQPGWTR